LIISFQTWCERVGLKMKDKKEKANSKYLSADDLSIFCAQVALVLQSAIPIQEGISAIYENITERKPREIVKQIADDVEQGLPLHKALENSGIFPPYMVNMVAIGEKSGKLEAVMSSLSSYYDREDSLRKRIKSAIFYPSILVLMMCAVLTILIVAVLPIFSDVFETMGSEMSATAKMFLSVGLSIGKYAYIALVILVLAIFLLYFFSQTKKGAVLVNAIIGKLLPTRMLSQKIAVARFSSVMSMMFSSGYNTDDALELASFVVSNKDVKAKIELSRDMMKKSASFSNSTVEAKLFTGIYARMVVIGEKTGSLDTVMEGLSKRYSEQADDSIDKAIALIEPTLVGTLCLVIGIILLTVMMPLMGIMSSIG